MYGPHPINYHRTKIVLRYKGIFEQNATRIFYVFDQSTKTLLHLIHICLLKEAHTYCIFLNISSKYVLIEYARKCILSTVFEKEHGAFVYSSNKKVFLSLKVTQWLFLKRGQFFTFELLKLGMFC